MTTLGTAIKKSMRIAHTFSDDEIDSNIAVCLKDMQRVGILSTLAVTTTTDPLIQKCCEYYCKWQFDFAGKGEQYEKNYNSLRDALSLVPDYTTEADNV